MMKNTTQFSVLVFTASLVLILGGCSRSKKYLPGTQTSLASQSNANRNSDRNVPDPCSPNPGASATAVGALIAGQPATIGFSLWGNCGYGFRVNGYTLDSSDQISITFSNAGPVSQSFSLQLVDTSGTPVPGVGAFTATFSGTVVAPPNPPPTAPTCHIERVLPPTTTEAQNVTKVKLILESGPANEVKINGQAVQPGAEFSLNPINAPYHYEALGTVTGPGGGGTCRLDFDVPYCTHQVTHLTSTSVTTELSFAGPATSIKIQNDPMQIPAQAPFKVSHTENFGGRYGANWGRSTTGEVANANGDIFHCPVTYAVPGVARPAPVFNTGHIQVNFHYTWDRNLITQDHGYAVSTGFGATGALGWWDHQFRVVTDPSTGGGVTNGQFYVVKPVTSPICQQPQDGGGVFSVVAGHAAAGHGVICARLKDHLQIINGEAVDQIWDFNVQAYCPGNKVMYGLQYYSCWFPNGCRRLFCGDLYVRPGI